MLLQTRKILENSGDRKKKSKEEPKFEEVSTAENAANIKRRRNQHRRLMYKLKTENITFKESLT